MNQKKPLSAKISLCVLSLASASALAQPALEEIVVTAQGRTQSLQDVPVSVSVVSGDLVERTNLLSFDELSTRLPNVQIAQGSRVDGLFIRGVGPGRNAGFEQSVAIFVDGVYRSRSRSSRAALLDIERVEVLKGPQITFFGANAIAGALNIATRKPGNEFEYNLRAMHSVDSYGEYVLEGGVTVPVSDTFSMRAVANFSGMTEGYVDNPIAGDGPVDENGTGRLSFSWMPTDWITSDFRLDGGKSDRDNPFSAQVTNCPASAEFPGNGPNCARHLAYLDSIGASPSGSLDYDNSYSPKSAANYDFYEAAWTNNFEVGPGTLTSITSYYDHDSYTFANGVPTQIVGTPYGFDAMPNSQFEEYDQFSQELRYTSEEGNVFDYMFGGYYSTSDQRLDVYNGFFFIPANRETGRFIPGMDVIEGKGTTAYGIYSEENETWSVFASGTWRPVDRMRVNFGLRYSNISKEADHRVTFGGTVNGKPDTFEEFDRPLVELLGNRVLNADLYGHEDPTRTDDKWMPSIGVQYDLTDDLMGYVSYSEGFKAGGYSASSLAETFEPEVVDSYEAGLKGAFFDGNLEASIAVFYSDYTNLQESSVIPSETGAVSRIGNAASTELKGVEVGGRFFVSDNVSLFADIGYLDAKYQDWETAPCTALQTALFTGDECAQDMSGKHRSNAPTWSGNIGANITIPMDELQVTIDPMLYFTSGFYQTNPTEDFQLYQPGNAKFDLRLGVGSFDGRWELSLIGKNLTDKTTGTRSGMIVGTGSTTIQLDPPRTVALQFTLRN